MPLHPPFFPSGFILYAPHIIFSKEDTNTFIKLKRLQEMHINNQTTIHHCTCLIIMKYLLLFFVVFLQNKLREREGKRKNLKENRAMAVFCGQQKLEERSRGSNFHIFAFFLTKSDPICLPWVTEKCFHVNYLHVQSWKAKLHTLVA